MAKISIGWLRDRVLLLAALVSVGMGLNAQQLDERCVVSVLNRTARVSATGAWVIPNVPANLGRVRARATCTVDGQTLVGQSEYFNVPADGLIDAVPITFAAPEPVPASLTLTAPQLIIPGVGGTLQLTATLSMPSGTGVDATTGVSGTNYTTSNPAVLTISEDGLATGTGSGVVIVSALNEGALGLLRITVGASADGDGDGMPDDWEVANGLNPADPADGALDPDGDGLNNRREFESGTDRGNADTDGDGVRDGLELQTASDPLNPNSYRLDRVLRHVAVMPPSALLRTNPLFGETTQQLNVVGTLLDGTTIDITSSARGTNYTSNDLTVCNFGEIDGQLFAGNSGTTSVTVSSNGFSAVVPIEVQNFIPSGLSSIAIPGYANNVKVSGSYAFVAAGSAGLQVVNISNPEAPAIAAALPLPGNANDVRLRNGIAYVAAGAAGLVVVDVQNPEVPVLLGSVNAGGDAQDVWVDDDYAYLANAAGALNIVNVAVPASPMVVSTLSLSEAARGVSVFDRHAVVVMDNAVVAVVDVDNAYSPAIVGSVQVQGELKDVVLEGTRAFIAAYTGGLQIVDYSVPASPTLFGSLPSAFVPRDLVLLGQFAIFAEQLFPNAIPFADISDPANPAFRDIIDLQSLGDYAGTGIDLDAQHVYVTAESYVVGTDVGVSADTRLFIAQYNEITDTANVSPVVSIVSPTASDSLVAGDNVMVTLDATDDIGVASVSVSLDGQVEKRSIRPPFNLPIKVPADVSSLTIGATAVDFGGNSTQATSVTVSVIPDPLTTVTGTVSAASTPIVAGATVALNEMTTTSDAAGHYTFTNVPTINGALVVHASATVAGEYNLGSSVARMPVRGGVTTIDVLIAPPVAGKVSTLPIPGFGNAIEAVGTTLYVAAGGGGLKVVDAFNPVAPQVVGTLNLDGAAYDVEVAGNLAYVSTGQLNVVDVTNAADPALVATLPDVSVNTLALHGNYVLGGGPNGLTVIDVSNSAAPVAIGALSFDDAVRTIAPSGTLAIVAEEGQYHSQHSGPESYVNVVDLSRIDSPSVMGRILVPGRVRSVVIRGSQAYLAMSTDNVEILDFSDPAMPSLLTPYNGYFQAIGIATRGDFVVLAGKEPYYGDVLQVVDMTAEPPSYLVDLHVQHDWYGRAVALSGQFAYTLAVQEPWNDFGAWSDTELVITRYFASTDNGGSAPTVTITQPTPAAQFIEGSTIPIEVTATDDHGVDFITLTAGGATIQTTRDVPLRVPFRVPSGITSLTFGATAKDLGGNVGTATAVTVSVQPDPLTTVTGIVRKTGGLPVQGAIVSIGAVTTTTDANGVYTFENMGTISGDYVVIARKIIDGEDVRGVSDPIAPVRGGTTNVPDITLVALVPGPISSIAITGFANAVDVRGRTAVVAAGGGGLQIVDFTDLDAPSRIGELALQDGPAYSVRISGTRAYAGSNQGVTVADITDPAQPAALGYVELTAPAQGLAAVGTTVFVANEFAGLTVIDAHLPAEPAIIGSLPLSGDSRAIAISGNLAVVTGRGYDFTGYNDFRSEVHIIDISSPQNPVLYVTTDVPGDATGVTLRGVIAYIASNDGGVSALDLSTPSAPVELDEYSDEVIPSTIAARGTRVVSAGTLDETRGVLDVFDITNSDLDHEEQVDFSTGRLYKPTGIALARDIAVVTGQNGNTENEIGFSGDTKLFFAKYTGVVDRAAIAPTISITAPANSANLIGGSQVLIQLQASDDIGLDVVTLKIDGAEAARFTGPPYQLLYTVPMSTGTLTFGATATDLGDNTSTATNVVVNVIPDPGTIVTGVVRDLSGTLVVDANVRVRGTTVLTDANGRYTANGVATIGGDLVIEAWATVGNEFVSGQAPPTVPQPAATTNIADITLQPLPVGAVANLAMPGYANAVSVHENLAAVAAGGAGLVLVDLSNPTRPAIVGQLALTGTASDVKLTEDVAYVVSWDGGLTTVDVTNPAQPQQLGYIATEGEAYDLAVSGTTVYVADGSHGLKIYDASNPAAPALIDSTTVTTFAKSVDVSGSYAVVVDRGHPWNGNSLVSIVDVSNPAQPQVTGTTTLSNATTDVLIRGSRAYVSANWGATHIVDFSTPESPYQPSTFYGSYWSGTVGDAGDYLLETGFISGVPGNFAYVIDATDPVSLFDSSTVDFSATGSYTGIDIEAMRELLVMTAGRGAGFDVIETEGDSQLFIGKFRELVNGQAKVNPKQ